MEFNGILLIYLTILLTITNSFGQSVKSVLNQGIFVGLKVFPEHSKTAVYAFLGIPYAQAPIGQLRFALPEEHNGWSNQTFLATQMKPICPQLTDSIYDEITDKSISIRLQTDEDCLYVNIWTPEAGFPNATLPVLVVITGEEMSFDWHQNRPSGLDLASESIVVVHIQYRTNIFGWLGINRSEFPGNFGLADQELALKWIQVNIEKFGGNPKQITLLGHGTTGVTCALLHLINPRNEKLFSKIILMSGAPLTFQIATDQIVSESIISKLGCEAEKPNQILQCLRSKSISDLKKSFEIVYKNGNYSKLLGPVVDKFTIQNKQYISHNLMDILKLGEYRKIPIMIGICSNEGAFIRDYWIDLAKSGYDSLKLYINSTILPLIFEKYHIVNGDKNQILKAINWNYFQLTKPRNPIYLLNAMQRLISEAVFEAPFYNIIELIARAIDNNSNQSSSADMFVYTFQTTNSMDLRGKINLFGGASHTSDLPLLMGPSLFQQIARRRFTPTEDKLCRRLRQLFSNFVKTGNPTPSRSYDSWQPYTARRKYIKILGEYQANRNSVTDNIEENYKEFEEILQKTDTTTGFDKRFNRQPLNPYEIRSTTDVRMGKTSYILNQQDYEYYEHLKKVYSFWNILLPGIYKAGSSAPNRIPVHNVTNEKDDGRETVVLAEILDCNKYKHAFFWMLGLVCVLLSSLGVCVYVIRRDYPGWRSNL